MTTEAKNRELLLLFFELDEKPDPAKKEAFLKIVMTGQITRATNMTLHRMLLIQVKYIRKTAWLAALMILLAAVLITMTTAFSLRSIRYARFMILGLFDMAVLAGISLLIRKYVAMSVLLTLAHLILPFLLTMIGALLLERTVFGRTHPYGSGVLALLIAVVTEGFLIPDSPVAIPFVMYGFGWVLELAAVFLLAAVIALFCANIKQDEEMTAIWN